METNGKYPEKWIKLYDDMIPEGQYFLNSIVDNNGLRVQLENRENSVTVFFDGTPLMVREMEDTLMGRRFFEVQKAYDDRYYFRNHFFFEVKNSPLIDWVLEQADPIYEADKLAHYCIVATGGIVDIVATFKPTISVKKNAEVDVLENEQSQVV